MLIKKRQRDDVEIPGSSLADIAFLLLIFFLVTTTINVDTGIGLVLPPIPDDTEPPPIRERNMLKILVGAQGQILINEEVTSMVEVRQKVKDFVMNPLNDPNLSESPDMAIVSIKTDRRTPYNAFVDMLDEVKGAYLELRNQESMARFGIPYRALEQDGVSQRSIRDLIPERISLAEPE
jgi:biopolymer transport protein ExbD